MTLKLTATQRKEAAITLFRLLTEGASEAEAMKEMGLDADEFTAIRAGMYEFKTDELKGTPKEHHYVRYVIDQMKNVYDLSLVVEAYTQPDEDGGVTKQITAVVGAIKARSEIQRHILEMGQEMGVIEKHTEGKGQLIRGGQLVGDLQHAELKRMILGTVSALQKLMTRAGDGNIIDIKPGQMHYGPSASAPAPAPLAAYQPGKDPPPAPTAKATTNKNTGGRRVVKDATPVLNSGTPTKAARPPG